jgi:hypothetical protein
MLIRLDVWKVKKKWFFFGDQVLGLFSLFCGLLRGRSSRVFTCPSVVDSQALRKPDLEAYICLGSTLRKVHVESKCTKNVVLTLASIETHFHAKNWARH